MKTSLRLSISFGLSVALMTVGCGGKSSKKSPEAPIAPQLKPDEKPGSVGNGNPAPTPGPTVDETPPTTVPKPEPVVPAPSVDPGSAENPIAVPPSNGGTLGVPPVTVPVVPPVPVVSQLHGLWGVSLSQKPRTCSTIYDIRTEKTLAVYILCPGDSGKNLSIQSDTFTLVSDDGANAAYQSESSSCIAQSRTLRFSYKVSSRGNNKFLVLTETGRASPELQSIPESALAGDLGAATRLYDRPLVRGCFVGGNLAKFEARRIVR